MPFQTLILAFTISWRTVLIFIALRTELIHLYTDSLIQLINISMAYRWRAVGGPLL